MAFARAICFALATFEVDFALAALALVALAAVADLVGFAPGALVAVLAFSGAFAIAALDGVAALPVAEVLGLAPLAGAGYAPSSAGLATSAPIVSTSAALARERLLNTCGAGAEDAAFCASTKVGAMAMMAASIIDLCNISFFPSAASSGLFGN
jgi:hypothetical protein